MFREVSDIPKLGEFGALPYPGIDPVAVGAKVVRVVWRVANGFCVPCVTCTVVNVENDGGIE